MEPIVSIIVPVYNSAKYISKSIESGLNQSIPVELIVIDDGSKDNIDEVMSKYKDNDNVIYLKNEINRGVAASRNKGIGIAKGKYIAYLDADDWWVNEKLKKQITLMEKTNTVLSYTGRQLVTSEGKTTDKIIHVPLDMDYKKLLYHNSIACSSVVVHRDVAIKYPMVHDEYHEDYINWLNILKHYGQAYGIDEPLLMYRTTENGKSRNKIKSAKMTFGVYRVMGYSRLHAFCFMFSHLIHGVMKYGIKG